MPLTHVLGKVPMIQVIDYMLEYMEYDCTTKEIIDHTGVGPTDMKRDFPGLVECGMVVETRKIGGVQLYSLDTDDVVLVALVDLDRAVSIHNVAAIITGQEEEPDPGDDFLTEEELIKMPRG